MVTTEVLIDCPSCDNTSLKGRYAPTCYLNPDKNVYYCHRCGAKGSFQESDLDNLNIIDIKEYQPFSKDAYDRLDEVGEAAFNYLNKRFNIDSENKAQLVQDFGLKYHPDYHAIAIPNIKDGEVIGIKYRFIAPLGDNRYIAEAGSEFGGYWLEGSADKLLVVEGEFDAMSAKLAGFEGTVLALQTNKLSQDSVNRVRGFKHVFLALDNDKGGIEGTATIKSLVQNPMIIKMPEGVKDLNEAYQSGQCSELLRVETQTDLERSTVTLSQSIGDMVTFLSDRRNTKGDSTGFNSLDHVLGGGLRSNEMTVVNAFAKTGKTSFINNIAHNLAVIGKKVAIASFEMDPARTLYPSLLSIAGQTNLRSLEDADMLRASIELIHSDCSYLNNIVTLRKFGVTPWSEVEEWAALMKKTHNIDYLVLDHAGFLVNKMTDAEENQILAKEIKKLTNTLGVHILVIVQAPKTKDGLSIQTSYGGLAWGMNADNFIILERSKEDETELRVKLEASRYPGARPSNTPALLYYDRETCTLSE